jgi:ADP-ribosyl-[dinitrogen reductase] hydrolase
MNSAVPMPVHIDSVGVPGAHGRIGMIPCPGLITRDMFGPGAPLDVESDLEAVSQWGAVALISLVEYHELADLGITDIGARAQARGLWWLHLPIRDFGVPDAHFEYVWRSEGQRLRGILLDDGRIVLHCWAGLGRTGTIAARLLVELGVGPKEAVRQVRASRPGTIQSRAQERYVRKCKGRK